MGKINIAELLRDCPSGMELDCTMYENVEFDYIEQSPESAYPIHCLMKINGGYNALVFTRNGCNDRHPNAKCVIFPKGKTTWEGFQRPFKDGDILATDLGSVFFLNTRLNTDECYGCYVGIGGDGSFHVCEPFAYKECCGLATEEEKEKLFQAIKDNGYKWNAETKTLEKLVKPRFKVGNKIKYINGKNKNGVEQGVILSITDDAYDVAVTNDMGIIVPIAKQDNWELVPDKFDINTLKPFNKVLARDTDLNVWVCRIYSHYRNTSNYKHVCIDNSYIQCVPYNDDTKHLVGTTNDCPEYYKTW